MSDLPLEGRTIQEKETPLTQDQQIEALRKDVIELARGINVQGALLESIVTAFDTIIRKYLILTRKHSEPAVPVDQNESK